MRPPNGFSIIFNLHIFWFIQPLPLHHELRNRKHGHRGDGRIRQLVDPPQIAEHHPTGIFGHELQHGHEELEVVTSPSGSTVG
jgi:hypothetical protein